MAKTGVAVLSTLLLVSCAIDRSGTRRPDAGVAGPDAGDVDAGRIDSGGIDSGGLDSGGLDGGGDDAGLDAGVLTVVEVAAGANTSCARRSDGAVFCWGQNDHGQLGDGATGATSRTPVQIALAGPAAQITVGWGHACARLASGDLYCWGDNGDGQVGDGTATDPHPTPGLVSGGVRDVSAGGSHTCLVDTMGRVGCWGANGSFQLGDEDPGRNTPSVVTLGADAIQVSLGLSHTCALSGGGLMRCWGENGSGQLGDDLNVDRAAPMTVTGLGAPTSIGLGELHSCAVVLAAGHCWGHGTGGRLGDGLSATIGLPSPVTTITNVRDIRAGDDHTCAVLVDGSLHCWGANNRDQLGIDNSRADLNEPGEVVSLAGRPVTSFSLGTEHTCLVTGGEAYCFGRNNQGQLSGMTADAPDPIRVDGLVP